MNPYDEVQYADYAFPDAHPARLGALTTLFGVDARPTGQARILDLGCAAGAHILPIADQYPTAQVVGLDSSEAQIARGRDLAARAGLTNVKLVVADLVDPPDLGTFDYIICHGVYSWVPAQAREAVWRILRRSLAPDGAAMVSCNTYPGWFGRGAIRGALLRVVPAEGSARDRIALAREFLAQWADALGDPHEAWPASILAELKLLDSLPDSYLLHEHLTPINEAFWFDDFAATAHRHGLRYVADAALRTHDPAFPDSVKQWRDEHAQGVVRSEAMNDLFRARYFRRSVFVRREAAPDPQPLPLRIADLWVSARLDRSDDGGFITDDGVEVEVGNELVERVIRAVVDARPAPLHIAELPAIAGEPGRRTLRRICDSLTALLSVGGVEIRTDYPAIAPRVHDRPATTPLTRIQAASDAHVVNLHHRGILFQPEYRALLRRLDGTLDRAELATALANDARAGEIELDVDDLADQEAVLAATDALLEQLRIRAMLLDD